MYENKQQFKIISICREDFLLLHQCRMGNFWA